MSAVVNTKITYAESGFQDKLLLDYLAQNPVLTKYISGFPSSDQIIKTASQKTYSNEQRETLVECIINQYQTRKLAVPSTLEMLSESNTYTITAGHQLCLFTGPLYLIYKICTAIKTAQILNKHQTEFQFVPVFWLASEDHDVEEIRSIHLFNQDIHWNTKQTGAVGRFQLSDIQDILNTLYTILGESPSAQHLITIFNKAYKAEHTLAQATHILLYELFKEHGLVILDGDDAILKNAINPLFIRDIKEKISDTKIQEVNLEWDSLGYKAQVNSRGVNFFHLSEHGQRERILNTNPETYLFEKSGETFTLDRLLNYFKQHPERISPNVIMRPLYQEFILPNLAVVCGPSEIRYWLQLKSTFDAHHISFPFLMLRDSFLWVDSSDAQKIEKLGLHNNDFFDTESNLIAKYLKQNSNSSIEAEKHEIKAVFAHLKQKLSHADPTLTSYGEAQEKALEDILDGINKKLTQSEKRKQETQINQIKKIKAKYFPNGEFQDRVENFIPFNLKDTFFINQIVESSSPFTSAIKVGVI